MKRRYSAAELLAEHDFARPHEAAGYRLHGGFSADGRYISPRTRHRLDAIAAWSERLSERGETLIDASERLLASGAYPTADQHAWLLQQGIGQVLWDDLTITGVIEARGRNLVNYRAPDFQALVREDLSETATGHLNGGLLLAHGLDEGGDTKSGLGGHDVMWFAARDLVFGAGAFPMPEVPVSIARPELGRLMPGLPLDYEQCILLLMNVLMIEVRAENFFATVSNVLRRPGLAPKGDDAAAQAAEMVGRIRQDEAPHVGYLRAVISELRSVHFRMSDGGYIAGAAFIDPVWRGMVEWHSVTTHQHARDVTRREVETILAKSGRTLEGFDALELRKAA